MDKPPKYNTVVLREDPPEYMVSQNIGKLRRLGVSGVFGMSGCLKCTVYRQGQMNSEEQLGQQDKKRVYEVTRCM